jgi:hypothetical protein
MMAQLCRTDKNPPYMRTKNGINYCIEIKQIEKRSCKFQRTNTGSLFYRCGLRPRGLEKRVLK